MKRWLACILSALLTVTALSGCELGAKQVNDSLTIWLIDPYIKSMFDRAFEDFEESHPGVPVQFAEMPEPMASVKGNEVEYKAYLNETLPQYSEKMRNEILMGKGPDLILFGGDTFPDLHKTMAAGAFCDLNPFIETDETYLYDSNGEPGRYRENILDGGIVDGKQYFLPLFYDFPGMTAPKANLDRYGITLSDTTTYLELLEELTKVISNPVPLECRGHSPAEEFADLAGVVKLDYEEKSVTVNEERLRRLVDTNKILLELPNFKPRDNAWDQLEEGKSLLYQDHRTDAFFGVSSIINVYDEPKVMPFRDSAGGIQAYIALAGAISNASPNKQNAYDFLKLCLQSPSQTMAHGSSGIPVNLVNYEIWLETQKLRNETRYANDYILVSNRQLPDELYKKLDQWSNEITGVSIETGLDGRIQKCFTPYYEEQKSYEACLAELKNELQIYISE